MEDYTFFYLITFIGAFIYFGFKEYKKSTRSKVDILRKDKKFMQGLKDLNKSMQDTEDALNRTAKRFGLEEVKVNKYKLSDFIDEADSNLKNKNESMTKQTSNQSPIDVTSELKKYHELKESGIITQEEFDKKKSELLK